MTTSNKILTVSYGTFSCTLEGFDDAFGTMKAIAEYFRDLAAEDRYFGAEPPTPDAEMLARIAEREIERRVEARLHGDEVRLRPREALPEPEAAPAPSSSPRPAGTDRSASEPDAPVTAQDAAAEEEPPGADASAAAEAAAVTGPEPPATVAEEPETESLADKLRRIREVAAREAEDVTEAEFIEDEHAEPLESAEEAWPEPVAEDVGAGVAELAPESGASEPAEAAEPIEADIDEALLARGNLEVAEEAEEDVEDTGEDIEDQEEEAPAAGEPDDAPLRLDRAAEEGAAEEPPATDGIGQDERLRSEDRLPDSAESEIDRLMEKTASVLREPSGRKRRNAISQLRAALMATREDTALAAGEDTEATSQPYRADLEAAVRPRRPNLPKETAAAHPRPGAGRPAPLRLVAEQRIDTPTPPPAVRPRRISTAAVMVEIEEGSTAPAGEGSFAAFIEEVGASGLSEVIEAAATYLAQVAGREEFTRPELMACVREVMGELPREEALRQFGRLLREGKILQTSGGKFAASDRIEYMSGGRAAG